MKKFTIQCNQTIFLTYLLLFILLTGNLVACGSSNGGGTGGETGGDDPVIKLTGVAATGKAMTGTVSLKDSDASILGPEPIASDGSFSFNVYGLVPPFYLVADDGMGNRLYSVAMSDGIANINPFTNLAVAVAAGVTDPADVYDNPDEHPITPEGINRALDELRHTFLSYLWAYDADINYITDPFVANHTGPDKLLDNLSIDIVSGIAFISDGEGNELGQLIAESLQNNASATVQISGNGFNEPEPGFLARLFVDIDQSSLTGQLRFAYQLLAFESTTITDILLIGNAITVRGIGMANGLPDYTFTAIINDSSPDAMGIEIYKPDGSLLSSIPAQDISGGTGFMVIDN